MIGTYRSFKIDDAAGVTAFTAVVQGAADGGCKKPTAANAAGFLGFTTDDQATQNLAVAVKMDGIARARCKGAVAAGHWVNIGDNAGRVADCQATVDAAPGTAAETNVIGKALTSGAADDDQILVIIRDFAVQQAVT